MWHIYFELIKQYHNWNKWIVCVQILVGLNWISFELLEKQLVHEERIQSTATDKISTVTFWYLTLAPNWILLKWWPSTKTVSSASELKWTKIEQFRMWIVNSDRQFCGTVYVISWTVALILSWRKIVNSEHVFVSSQDLLVKQGTFLYEAWPDLAEKRDILNTGNLDISGIGYGKFCSLMNC